MKIVNKNQIFFLEHSLLCSPIQKIFNIVEQIDRFVDYTEMIFHRLPSTSNCKANKWK